jgi:PAS domain S-box-containing protein
MPDSDPRHRPGRWITALRGVSSSLRGRLLLGALIPLALFLAAALVAFVTILRLTRAEQDERRSREFLTHAYQLKAHLALMAADHRGYRLLGQPGFKSSYDDHAAAVKESTDALLDLGGDEEYHGQIHTIAQQVGDWRQLIETDFSVLLPTPLDTEKEYRHLDETTRQHDQIIDEINQVVRSERSLLFARRAEVREAANRGLWMIPVVAVTAIVLSLLIPLRLSRTITEPLGRLSEATQELRRGRFTTLPLAGVSELHALTSYFNMMGLALAERETLLRVSERRYQALLGSFHNLLWNTDAEGAFASDFSGWTAFTGQDVEEIQGEGWLRAVHPDDRPRVTQAWRQAVASRNTFQGEFRIRRYDECYRKFSCRCVPIFDPKGAILEWACACTDITERAAQEELLREKDAAEAASEAKTRFLTRMSHELRTPLNVVIGMSQMLASQRFGSLNPKQADYVADIAKSGRHLLALINDVLDLSKVESGHMRVQPEKAMIGNAIRGVVSVMQGLIEGKRQTLHCDLPQPDRQIVTDVSRFKQILLNLLSNAMKFTPEGGSITVRGRWVAQLARDAATCPADQAAAVRVDVVDTGIGIPPEEQQNVWREFHQVSGPAAAAEGTGLGLPLARHLVRLLGGQIWLQSAPGQGSCFSFVLPLESTDEPTGTAASAARSRPVAQSS